MDRCPAEPRLRCLIADDLPADEQLVLEAHLTGCLDCRNRIDALAEIPQLIAAIGPSGIIPLEYTPSLKLVIERLRSDSPGNTPSPSDSVIDRHHRLILPGMQSTTRPGYLGRLGGIEIRKVIGRGGMGVVFEGLDPVLDRVVAVKVLAPHLTHDADAVNRFLREARAAATLHHENVVSIHAIDEAEGMPYLVLQYVRGESLAARTLREPRLPFDDVVRIGIEIARGLAAAHAQGLVHRDIKPANILIDAETGGVRIADFGLVKQAGLDSLTEIGAVAGTPAFMSPEQVDGSPLDARSDLFSVGVLLYSLSTGELPFRGETPFSMMQSIRNAEPQPIRERNAELPAWFAVIVHRLLEKNPANRFASAAELETALAGRTASTPAPKKRTSYGWYAGVIAIAAIAAVSFWFRVPSPDVTPERAITDKPPVETLAIDAPSVPITPGFIVAGMASAFATLTEAVDAAGDDDTITVHGDGPFTTGTIRIAGKRLKIRAGPGSRPRFVPDIPGEGGPLQFLVSDSDLTIEGLDIRWTVPVPLKSTEELSSRCVVLVTGGDLVVNHSRVSCGFMAGGLGSWGRSATVTHCHLLASFGSAVVWRQAEGAFAIDQCVIEARLAISVSPTTAKSVTDAGMKIANSTVIGERAWIIFNDGPRPAFKIDAVRTVFDTAYLLTFTSIKPTAPPLLMNNNAVIHAALRSGVVWTETANVYAKGSPFLAGTISNRPNFNYGTNLKTLPQWLDYWKLTESQSVDGKIRYAAKADADAIPKFESLDTPSGAVPSPVGHDPQRVGPAVPVTMKP